MMGSGFELQLSSAIGVGVGVAVNRAPTHRGHLDERLGGVRIRLAPGLMGRLDLAARPLLGLDAAVEIIAHLVGHAECWLLGPAHGLFCTRGLLGAQGGAVGLVLARNPRAASADHRSQHDQAGSIAPAARLLEGVGEFRDRLAVDGTLDVPALGLEGADTSSLKESSVAPSMVTRLSS